MSTTRSVSALWFSIETAMADVRELCVRARAGQIAAERARGPMPLQRTMVSGALPREAAVDPVVDEDPRLARAVELSRDLAFREENAGGPDLVALRALVRRRLVWLRGKMAEVLNDHELYYALFPIVVYVDELVQIATRGEAGRWEPLQSELYDIDNGGERFFTILDERLRQQETNPIVLEIYFFCLSDGFTGMHQADPKKLEEYKARLADRIPVRPVLAAEAPGPRSVELVSFPWQYYAVAAAAVVAVYALLAWLATPSS